MFIRRLCVFFLLGSLLLVLPATAQRSPAPSSEAPSHNLEAFAPLDLPTPNSYRLGSGAPGEAYWQQRADYTIRVTLDPSTHRIEGTETITYTNNAPEPLDYLWVQLDQNLFKTDSRGARLLPPDSRWRGAFDEGGYAIGRVALVRDGQRVEPEYLIDDTRMRISLDEPLAAEGGMLELEVDFAFTIPPYGADRMGRLDVEQGTVYELAQWYPRMYVFDDVRGWNPMPYLGQGEYYLEYGDFDVEITVPRDFVVAATGALQNPDEVLTPTQQERLAQARQSEETVAIITREEVGQPGTRPDSQDMLTWKFRAENVRDVAWAASQAFIWDAAGYNDALVQSFYPQEGLGSQGTPGWEASTQYSRHAIKHYSERWFAYPYPVAINVAGIVGGMEYPMIVFCSVNARGPSLFGVTDHEFGHQWFPMIVGSDERRYAWMDEGFNTFLNYYSTLAFYGEENARTQRMSGDYATANMGSHLADQPVATYPDRIRREGLGFLAYRKPGYGLVLLRDYILGPERFDPAFKEYIRRWAYKHPQPADFFRTMADVTGEELDWFWRGWLYSTDTLDFAITDVTTADSTSQVTVANEGGLVMPVTLDVLYENGTSERVRVPVEAFFTTNQHVVTLRGVATEVRLDPDGFLPDTDRSDDVWQAEMPGSR